jgi:hypothetical protein
MKVRFGFPPKMESAIRGSEFVIEPSPERASRTQIEPSRVAQNVASAGQVPGARPRRLCAMTSAAFSDADRSAAETSETIRAIGRKPGGVKVRLGAAWAGAVIVG